MMTTADWEQYNLELASGEVSLEMQQKYVQDQKEKAEYQANADFLATQTVGA